MIESLSLFFIEWGYWGLFISAFLAATIFPLSSEVILTALLLKEFPVAPLVIIATLANVLGSLLNYTIAYWGGDYLFIRYFKSSRIEFENAKVRFKKYGMLSLLFAWLPVIGDPITVAAGLLRVPLMYFIVIVALGKFLRYALLSYGVISI